MALALSLPRTDTRPEKPPETRPARVERWLGEAVKRDTIEAAAAISDTLAATNRVPLGMVRRRQLADQYYATALTLWPALERHFVRATHPLNGPALAAAKSALMLATELSTAYKHLLAQAERRWLFTSRRSLASLVHRCLQCHTRILTISYMSYSPVPARTWHDAHAINLFALQRKLHRTPVTADTTSTTPERQYVEALLVALANPYGFTPGQLAQVMLYLRENAHLAKLTDVPPVHRLAKAVAIVPIGHDFPPFAANKGGNLDGTKLFLLTFDLAFQIQEQLRAMEGGAPAPAFAGLDAEAKSRYMALVRRLLRQWAIPPARQFNRLPSRARVAICAGFAGAWQYTPGSHAAADIASARPAMSICQVINQTPAGYALRQIDTAHSSLRIGELVVLRVDSRNTLQLAMIRWFRNTLRGSGFEFGCELLSDRPEAASVRLEGAELASFQPAVILPEDGQDGTPAALLVRAGAFQVEQAVLLRRADATTTAVLTKLVEQGPGFELFEYVAVA